MTTSDEKIASVGSIVQEKASVIWNLANPQEYSLVTAGWRNGARRDEGDH